MTYFMINSINRRNKGLRGDNRGILAVEFAFLLPIFIVLTLGVIEFGVWFFESEITTHSVNNISQAIQNNPKITTAQLQSMVNTANAGMTRLRFYDPASNPGSKSYICVKSYTSTAAAQAGKCVKGDLDASNPNPGSPYAVAIDAFVDPNPITPIGNFIHGLTPAALSMTQNTVSTIGNLNLANSCVNKVGFWAIMQYDPKATPQFSCNYIPIPQTPPKCDGPGQVLQYDGTKYITPCPTLTPPINCHEPWQNLEWDSAKRIWSCPNVPWVFAGGVAHATLSTPGAFWADNAKSTPVFEPGSYVSWIKAVYPVDAVKGYSLMNRSTMCTPVAFTVPAGLPAGQIIAQGNLIYPISGGGDGKWKHWTVSFIHLDTGPAPPTTSQYDGSAYLCLDDGSNWLTINDPNDKINSEHESWTIIFIPN